MGRTIKHCTNCKWRRWHEPNHKCFECEPTGKGPSNFLYDGTRTVVYDTERQYRARKEKLDDNF
jgi:hypothetical protein